MTKPVSKPTVCVSMGDPAGIGPEVLARALSDPGLSAMARWVVTGSERAFRRALEATRAQVEYAVFNAALPDALPASPVVLLDVGAGDVPRPGSPNEAGGRWAGLAIRAAVELALKGRADCMVTAPISKAHLFAAGFNFPGHTEMLASLCGVRKPLMLMAAGELRVAVFTRHVPLHSVFKYLKKSALADTVLTLARELKRWFGIERPRIAVTGLNPHCGEGGLFGTEDDEVIRPAVEQARRKGADAVGPLPADSLFRPRERSRYDCILAMYHDQGLAPFKALSGDEGVNVTLNLPFLRTSPDHGTAFDIAPRFEADPSSMCAAMRLAARFGGRRWA